MCRVWDLGIVYWYKMGEIGDGSCMGGVYWCLYGGWMQKSAVSAQEGHLSLSDK